MKCECKDTSIGVAPPTLQTGVESTKYGTQYIQLGDVIGDVVVVFDGVADGAANLNTKLT